METSTAIPWYIVKNIDQFDTPCVVMYKDRITQNIDKFISRVDDVSLLRPHVKTNKIAEVCRMMMDRGIRKFKCATIAEAEMLASIQAPDILVAYQPVGTNVNRLTQLVATFESSSFSCTVDHRAAAKNISDIFSKTGLKASVYIDLNTGMNRTGVTGPHVKEFVDYLCELPGIHVAGIHAYDGHVKEKELSLRQKSSDAAFALVESILKHTEEKVGRHLPVIAGGSPSFITHLGRKVEFSPGTFVFWDWGYKLNCPEEPYEFAALAVTRIISIVDEHTITTDLGYKSITSESPMPRMFFLNAPGAKQVMHSEEHLTLHVESSSRYVPGDVLYAVPVHICPTISLYDEVNVAINNLIIDRWEVVARKRKITI